MKYMKIFRQYMPQEWEYAAGVKTTAINMYILVAMLFVFANWKIGVCALCGILFIDYIGILINRYNYMKKEREFKNYVMSGLTPCLLYTKATDPVASMHKFIVDDRLSVAFAHMDAEYLAFQPVIVFLSQQSKTELSTKCFDTPTKAQKFYKEKIAQLPSCTLTDKNIAVIKAVLEYKQDLDDYDYIDEMKKSISSKKANK